MTVSKMKHWEEQQRMVPAVRQTIADATAYKIGLYILALGLILIAVAGAFQTYNSYGGKTITDFMKLLPRVFGGVGAGVALIGVLVTGIMYYQGRYSRNMIYGQDSDKILTGLVKDFATKNT